jgi:hypothetical protein
VKKQQSWTLGDPSGSPFIKLKEATIMPVLYFVALVAFVCNKMGNNYYTKDFNSVIKLGKHAQNHVLFSPLDTLQEILCNYKV